jgi:hypothetical protein
MVKRGNQTLPASDAGLDFRRGKTGNFPLAYGV